MALGARRRHILGMVCRNPIIMIAVGILLGESASLALTWFISNQIWGAAIDPSTFVAVAIVFLLCGVAWAVLPAQRGTQMEPISALRRE